jgi:AraC-like DNA-binding protein
MLVDRLLSNLSVRVEPFALCQLSSGWRMRLPGPPDVMLHYVLKGRGAVRGPDGEARTISTAWLVIVPPRADHVLETGASIRDELRIDTTPAGPPVQSFIAGSASTSDLIVACGVIHVRYGQSLGLFDRLREVLVVDLSGIPQVPAAFEGIFGEQSSAVAGSATMTSALMTQCLVHVFRRLPSEAEQALPWLMALKDRRLAQAIDLILDDPAADHSVESLAVSASMSRSSFAERFAAAFARSPMSFVHHIRMQRAVELLELGTLSIDQVSSRVGFASRSHFSRAFKKHTGISPVQFRQTVNAAALPATSD